MASGQPQNVATASAIVPTIPAMAPAASVNVATHLSLFEHLPDEMLLEILKIHLSQSRVLAIKARVTRSFRRVRANDDTVEVHAIKKVSFRVAPHCAPLHLNLSRRLQHITQLVTGGVEAKALKNPNAIFYINNMVQLINQMDDFRAIRNSTGVWDASNLNITHIAFDKEPFYLDIKDGDGNRLIQKLNYFLFLFPHIVKVSLVVGDSIEQAQSMDSFTKAVHGWISATGVSQQMNQGFADAVEEYRKGGQVKAKLERVLLGYPVVVDQVRWV